MCVASTAVWVARGYARWNWMRGHYGIGRRNGTVGRRQWWMVPAMSLVTVDPVQMRCTREAAW
jgi:hypothetical protein